MAIDLKRLLPTIRVTQRDLDRFIDPESRVRIGAAAGQLTGAAAVTQQIDRSANLVVYTLAGILAVVVVIWLARR